MIISKDHHVVEYEIYIKGHLISNDIRKIYQRSKYHEDTKISQLI